jgi:hypothetical protein
MSEQIPPASDIDSASKKDMQQQNDDKKEPQQESKVEKKSPKRKERKRYPPLSDMLVYGAPEEQGKPKSFWQLAEFPIFLVIVFFISITIFLNAPHHLSKGKQRRGYAMNQKVVKYVRPKVIPYKEPSVDESKILGEL